MELLASYHPKVVHFAVGLLTTYILIELLFLIFKKDYLNYSANLILFLGILGAGASMITGNQAFHYADYLFENFDVKIPLGLIDEHENYATITMFWFLGLLLVRIYLTIKKKLKGVFQIIVFVLALTGGYFIYQTGELGGKLVYEHGVGTKIIEHGIEKSIPGESNQLEE